MRGNFGLSKRERMLPTVFEFVRGIESSLGDKDVERIHNPIPDLHHIAMCQVQWDGIHWEGDPTPGWIDPEAALRERLIDKMTNKSYETEHPIELVVYFWREVTPPPETGWIEAMQQVVTELLTASPFRRVWLYDGWTKSANLLAESGTLNT